MRVGLFIPCYIDQFFPQVGLATVELLEQFGCEVEYPESQTCCGQPMANTGLLEQAKPLAKSYVSMFADFEYVVCPSGSCTAMVTHHYGDLFPPEDAGLKKVQENTFELTEFLTDVLKVENISAKFPYRVGLHNSCHGLRELRLGSASELMQNRFSKARQLLEQVEGIELVELSRIDECCGFGGTFAVSEEAVSCMMGNDRIHDHEEAGAQIITAGDMSCLMHLDGLLRRQKKPIQVMHIAEILTGATPSHLVTG
ncbi:Lactate utilization protein A [Thalassoglobus neptunius]|uniref:Lactate utilization protein A n=1 Tax=Thalassoglobus neptunius TaxID=1938619 RepID=A0A5C5WP28_9PLAN|nr:(Fe-S)-binding protein [Thalassoglobus neptunius]TWT51572.1 Lactate utilization protein A [Thalassoglobus neptunius]